MLCSVRPLLFSIAWLKNLLCYMNYDTWLKYRFILRHNRGVVVLVLGTQLSGVSSYLENNMYDTSLTGAQLSASPQSVTF